MEKKSKIKKIITVFGVALLIIVLMLIKSGIGFLWMSNHSLYTSPVEFVNSQYSGYYDWQADSVVYQYENEKQAFFIVQTNNGSFVEINMKVRNVFDEKYYEFRESSHSSDIKNSTMKWYEAGMFKYFAVENKEDIEKYGADETPTHCDEIYYKTSDGKEKHCYMYIVDPLQEKDETVQ